jgi:hypothetical protein
MSADFRLGKVMKFARATSCTTLHHTTWRQYYGVARGRPSFSNPSHMARDRCQANSALARPSQQNISGGKRHRPLAPFPT